VSTGEAQQLIFGNTPMRACFGEVSSRFVREQGKPSNWLKRLFGQPVPKEERVLLVVSDGEPTDGDPTEYVDAMKKSGIYVACAYITDRDVREPRHLPATEEANWPEGARLLFRLASLVDSADATLTRAHPSWRRALEQSGWTAPPGARLFVQVNHSEVLADFMRVAATAIPAQELFAQGLALLGDQP